MSRVFLNYSHKNEDFVKDLYRKLSRDGVECFFDKKSIAWGVNWVIELEKGIDKCEAVILVLSPAYCQSEWTNLERTSSMADDPSGLKRRLFPLLLEPCGNLLPRFLKPIQYIDVSTPEKFDAAYSQICHALGGTPIEVNRHPNREQLPLICRLPDRNRMPYRSLGNGFVGRVNDLWEINDILQERKTAVVEGVGIVMGMAGVGKTQLAIEYVHRFGVNYPGGVFWVNADQGISTLIKQVSQGAGIDIDNTFKEEDQLIQLWKTLNQFQHVLIILDNFPEDEGIQAWLPPAGSIFTLVTTKRRDLNYSRLPINCMTVEEGLTLLNKGDRKFGKGAGKLVEALGGLPLALELSRNYLNLRPEVTVDRLLQEIKKTGEIKALGIFAKKYANELPTLHIKEISATFQISWNIASKTAKSVLQCMSLLAPPPVPRRLLRKILDVPSGNILGDSLDEAISELTKKLSLTELDQENDPLIHRLISAFVKTTTIKNKNLHKKVVKAVIQEMERVTDERDIKSYYELEKILPHAEILSSPEYAEIEQAIDLTNYLARQNQKWGRYRVAEKHGRKSLTLSEKYLKPGHPTIAIRQSNLAMVLKDLGELNEARDLAHKAYKTFLDKFGPEHPQTIISKRNWESLYKTSID